MSPVRYELGSYILVGDILHSHRRENLKSYIALAGWALYWRRNVSPVRYELGFYILEGDILHSHRHGNLKSYAASLQIVLNLNMGNPQALLIQRIDNYRQERVCSAGSMVVTTMRYVPYRA
jgi:hypothetical protein